MPARMVQLPLNLPLRDDATFASFYGARNQTLVDLLQYQHTAPDTTAVQFIFIHGAPGVGRSHLLQAACHQTDQSMYLPMAELLQHSPQLLAGIEQLPLVCLDDLELIAGQLVWEQALFGLLNRLHDAKTRLLIAAAKPPKALGITLPDLVSRLSGGGVFHLQPLNDQEKRLALQHRAQLRGLVMGADVARYIMHHSHRNMHHLCQLLDTLDQAALRAKHKLTLPFVKHVMGW